MNITSRRSRNTGVMVTSVITAVGNIFFAASLPSTLASFEEMFRGFGATLPAATRLVLKLPYLWWMFALAAAAVAVWVCLRPYAVDEEYGDMKKALGALIILTMLAFAILVYCIYLPIFRLGSVV